MWFLGISAIVILVISILLTLGFHRVSITRRTGPDEGIEDDSVVKAYDKISQWLL